MGAVVDIVADLMALEVQSFEVMLPNLFQTKQ
jgi:hypothetical protein